MRGSEQSQSFMARAKSLLSHSTIAGINKISRAKTASDKKLWAVFIALASVGCFILCEKGYSDYISYTVQTNVQLDVPIKKGVDKYSLFIPNLIFCQYYSIKRSVYHSDAMAKEYNFKLATAFIPPNDNASHWKEQFARYCPPLSNEAPSIPIDFSGLSSNTNLFARLIDLACQVVTSRRDVLMKCLWRGVEFACNLPEQPTMITDVYTDYTLCYRFEYDDAWVSNSSKINEKYVLRSKSHDLTLLIDLKQNQRCGHMMPLTGEGLSISTLDRLSLFATNVLQRRFNIHPGYEYVAKIKNVKTIRNTENLGRCTSKTFSASNRSLPIVGYTKSYCKAISLFRSLYFKCGCIPPVPDWTVPYLTKETIGIEVDFRNLCSKTIPSLSCLLESMIPESMAAFASKVSNCPDACVEINPVHSYLVKKKLTTAYIGNFLTSAHNLSVTLENQTLQKWIDKNAIVLHVNFETNKIDVMTENQVFTLLDLLRYLASACELFFGMSCISFIEIVYLICRLFPRGLIKLHK